MIQYAIILTLIFMLIYKRKKHYIDETCFVEKSVISSKQCDKIINIANKYKFDKKIENVDGKPEYQIDIFDYGIKNGELWEICKEICHTKLKNIMEREKWIPKDRRLLKYVFLKRYTPHERSYIPLHYDDNYLTMSFLLSNTNNFKGGELYVFDLDMSKELDKLDKCIKMTIERRNDIINKYKNLPVLKYNQGDVAVYTGGIHMHGTLPVTHGERYILTFFFE
jgi:hypothetical protein